ncbi:hypothetical protein HPP92_014996 [Vanilla planifolia]|uniref:4-coumarate--CoA ligase n=1 Tax=Vanilla planifolia TaxID=51239 RepID=A0A835URM0_VANPL|nr:hypothetical protein HPP92_014996 [Vanilla planifolia]
MPSPPPLSTTHSVRKGQVVLLLSPNSLHVPVIALAVISLGAVITTTNPLNTPLEIAKQVAHAQPVLAFTTPSLLPKLAGHAFPVVLLEDQTVQDMILNKPGRSLLETVRQDDPATLLYSSGTTGTSKGVISTHRNLIALVQIQLARFPDRNTVVCTVPMFHVYGLAGIVFGLLATGSTVVILPQFEMRAMLRAVVDYEANCLALVPPILVALMGAEEPPRSLGTLRKVFSGGAPLSKEVIEGFLERFPEVEILQGYGLTESTAMGASMNTTEEGLRHGTAGLLAPNTEARIVDLVTGAPLPINCTGELWIRGPYIMIGYLKNPEATQLTLDSEGWLKTGDLCYIDEDGYLFVVDRIKELIKYNGYQVAPAELEALLLTHPEIVDAAVIPLPDKTAGQIPMAYVVRKEGSRLSEALVMEYVRGMVAPYKRIRRVAFLPAIPKNPSGKILRKDLVLFATSTSKL